MALASLNAQLTGSITMTNTATVGGSTVSAAPSHNFSDSLSLGTGLDQGDLVYSAKAVAISGSATNALDVSGSLSDVYGTTITAVKMKMFYLKNLSTTAGDTLTIGGDANGMLLMDAAADTITIQPNGFILLWQPSLAGMAVTAATGDIIDILENAGNANTYDVAFIATTA